MLCGAALPLSISISAEDDGPPRCPTCTRLLRVRGKTLSKISAIEPDAAVPVLSGDFARGDGEIFRRKALCNRGNGQLSLFAPARRPVVVAWGAGVDSTALLVEMVGRDEKPDLVLFADTGAEKPETYAFVPIFRRWLECHGVQVEIVRYQPKNFKNWPPYRTLTENCLTNGTLPSLAFGFKSCSLKWKVTPQNSFVGAWAPARECWADGGRVIKLIGYDCSPADAKRYAEIEGHTDPSYEYRYPLRDLGWTRENCIRAIVAAGLPVPVKSACFFCPASKPLELHTLPIHQLRSIVLMEARATPRLEKIQGLWRNGTKGTRGGTPKPGRMTDYIREQELLPSSEIDRIWDLAPPELIRWQESFATGRHSQPMKDWLDYFNEAREGEGGEA